MVAKSPGIFEVGYDYVKENIKWAINNPLYNWYFLVFVSFGTAGIWFDFAFPGKNTDRGDFVSIFGFTPLITFSAPIVVAILAKHILIGFTHAHNEYPMKTLRTFCLLYFLLVIACFVIGYSIEGGKTSGFCILSVVLLLFFQFIYGAKDPDYVDVNLDVSARESGRKKSDLSGEGYE